MTSLTAKKTYRIIEYILAKKEFTQYSLEKELKGISHGLINKVFKWLEDKMFIERYESKYHLKDAAGIIIAISMQRSMEMLKIAEFNTSLSKKEIMSMLPKNAIFCLDSATDNYTNYMRSNRVCAHVDRDALNELNKKFFFNRGNKTTLCIYEEKPKIIESKEIGGRKFTGLIRTIIDMACDNKIYLVEGLIKKTWGASLGSA